MHRYLPARFTACADAFVAVTTTNIPIMQTSIFIGPPSLVYASNHKSCPLSVKGGHLPRRHGFSYRRVRRHTKITNLERFDPENRIFVGANGMCVKDQKADIAEGGLTISKPIECDISPSLLRTSFQRRRRCIIRQAMVWVGAMLYLFESFAVDDAQGELRTTGDTIIPIGPQVFDLLVHLIKNRERVVSKDDLIASVWGGRIVSDSTLTSRINAARRALGDSGGEQKLIRTVPRKGLRFVATVLTQANAVDPGEATGSPPDEITALSRLALPLPDRPAVAVLPFTNMS